MHVSVTSLLYNIKESLRVNEANVTDGLLRNASNPYVPRSPYATKNNEKGASNRT